MTFWGPTQTYCAYSPSVPHKAVVAGAGDPSPTASCFPLGTGTHEHLHLLLEAGLGRACSSSMMLRRLPVVPWLQLTMETPCERWGVWCATGLGCTWPLQCPAARGPVGWMAAWSLPQCPRQGRGEDPGYLCLPGCDVAPVLGDGTCIPGDILCFLLFPKECAKAWVN